MLRKAPGSVKHAPEDRASPMTGEADPEQAGRVKPGPYEPEPDGNRQYRGDSLAPRS